MPPERIYQGTGPGPITPDGCAVDYYAMLTPDGEPEIVHAAIPEGAAILELGAGAGRITRALLALGHEVVAVDESPEMLAHINGAETVLSRIQDLSLARMFDVVLLMSYVIDTADDDLCRAFLRTCRRHVAPDGCVILQRQPPEWYDTVEPSERRRDGRVIRMRDVKPARAGSARRDDGVCRGGPAVDAHVRQQAPYGRPVRGITVRGRAHDGGLPPRRPAMGAGGGGMTRPARGESGERSAR